MGAQAGSLDEPLQVDHVDDAPFRIDHVEEDVEPLQVDHVEKELEHQAEKVADAVDLQAAVEAMRAENEALRRENAELRNAPRPPGGNATTNGSSTSACSGCRLRAAMTNSGTTQDELGRCISVVEASLGEARRELSRKELSNRRARYEQLHRAMVLGTDEALLAEAITAATEAGVDQEELEKARTKLEELRSMTPEQRQERENKELEAKRKKEAFLLVKKNIAEPLTTFIDGLDDTVRWQDWRDHAGRTLLKCAQELRASKAQEVLAERIQAKAEAEAAAAAARPALSPSTRKQPKPAAPSKEEMGSQATTKLMEQSSGTLSTKFAVISEVPVAELRRVAAERQTRLSLRRDSVAVPIVRDLLAEPREIREDEGDVPMGAFFSLMDDEHTSVDLRSFPGGHRPSFGGNRMSIVSRGSIATAPGGNRTSIVSRGSIATASYPFDVAAIRAHHRRSTTTEMSKVTASEEDGGQPQTVEEEEEDLSEESEEEEDDVCPPEVEAEFKTKAFRAVVQDDCDSLSKVLDMVKPRWWSKWENKAGKDLLTLSEERGSSKAYLLLGKTLEIIRETKREVFEEREAVWIFANGDVQPRRATVLEDTPAHVDEILVEFWDGNGPPEHVDRCSVAKGA